MTGPLILQERDGTREPITMVRPDPPESDTIVKRWDAGRRVEYHFSELDAEGVPVYVAR